MSTNVKCYYKKTIEWKKKNGKNKKQKKKDQVRTCAAVGATCAAREPGVCRALARLGMSDC